MTRVDPLAKNTGGVNCFLTGIGGHFWGGTVSDGVSIDYDAANSQYVMRTSNGKTGWANCVK